MSCFLAGWAPEKTAKVGKRGRRDELILKTLDPLCQRVPDVWSKKVSPPCVLPAFTATPSSPPQSSYSGPSCVHSWQIGTPNGSCFAQLIYFGKSGGSSQTVGQAFSRELTQLFPKHYIQPTHLGFLLTWSRHGRGWHRSLRGASAPRIQKVTKTKDIH